MRKVKELMTMNPPYCGNCENLLSADAQMTKRSLVFLTVVDQNRKVVGTIHEKEIQRALSNSKKPLQEIMVSEVMQKAPCTIHPNDNEAVALQIMRVRKVARMPVVDIENNLMGLISFMQIARRMVYEKGKILNF